jgi:hypothetical protein
MDTGKKVIVAKKGSGNDYLQAEESMKGRPL